MDQSSLTAKSFLLAGIVFVSPANRHRVPAPKLQRGIPLADVLSGPAGNLNPAASGWYCLLMLFTQAQVYGKTFSCFVPFMDNLFGILAHN